MSKYTPHTQQDKQQMLKEIGVSSIDALFADVPKSLRCKELAIGKGKSQFEVADKLEALANQNKIYKTILRGAGAYDHVIPPVVPALASREEFVTAYTPYQPEISQGILQAIFEYQSMVCELSGMEVSNASVYDGATAAAEAMIMCCDKRSTIVLAGEINPETIAVVKTYAFAANLKVAVVGSKNGLVDINVLKASLNDDTACILAQNPNFLGLIEDMAQIGNVAHENGAKFIYSYNPIAAALLPTPAQHGADVAVAEGQPLGLPLSYGGPYLGMLSCTKAMSRRMPGRIVGQTVDKNDKRAFVLTMQAREQHIRREKALSSICSNQALCALTAAMFLTAVGQNGLIEIAEQCASKAHYFAKQLCSINGFNLEYKSEFFHEFTTKSTLEASKIEKLLDKAGILSGLKIDKHRMLWCVTEKVSVQQLDKVVEILRRESK